MAFLRFHLKIISRLICFLMIVNFWSCTSKSEQTEEPNIISLILDKEWNIFEFHHKGFYKPFEETINIASERLPYIDPNLNRISFRFLRRGNQIEMKYQNKYTFLLGSWEQASNHSIYVIFFQPLDVSNQTLEERNAYSIIKSNYINNFIRDDNKYNYTFKFTKALTLTAEFEVFIDDYSHLGDKFQAQITEANIKDKFVSYSFNTILKLNDF